MGEDVLRAQPVGGGMSLLFSASQEHLLFLPMHPPTPPVPWPLSFQGSGPVYCKTSSWAAVTSCLGKGLYEASTLASPGLQDFFASASGRERPWQLTLDHRLLGVGWGGSDLFCSQLGLMRWAGAWARGP